MPPTLLHKPPLNHSALRKWVIIGCCTYSSAFCSPETLTLYDHKLNTCNGLLPLKTIHSSLTTAGFIKKTPHLGAQIIIKYAKFGHLKSARFLFDHIHGDNKSSSFLWNTMIRAYANGGHYVETLDLYSLMCRAGISPNNFTFPFVFKACALILQGKLVHGTVIKTGFDSDLHVESALLSMYSKCGQTEDGLKVFDDMPVRDLVCWTAMITAYEQAEQPREAIMLFRKMQKMGLSADSVTLVSIASAVGQVGDAMTAQSVHAYAISNGFLMDLSAINSLVSMYGKCGNVEKARLIFDKMDIRDEISWNSMLSGYTQNGQASEALMLYEHMMKYSECKPNPVTALILVSAYAYLGSCQLGRKFHNFIIDNKLKIDVNLWNALMDMYAKCGDLDTTVDMFDKIRPSEQDVTAWNVLISGYGMHGHGKEALECFTNMVEQGVKPNHITFTCLLSACSHAGLIEEGKIHFASMTNHSVTPEVKHYACMVDMFGRAGRLDEAYNLIKNMPSEPNDGVWGALLLACRIHKNSKLGEVAANHLFQLEPRHPGYYVLMSNIYAASNKWREVRELRQDMKKKGLKKTAAFSVVEVGNDVYGFHTADQVSPYRDDVVKKVKSLVVEMKMAGYTPDLSCALHDVEEEDKEEILYYHSEKLAVAFGIMKNDARLPIRVTKNLRVCNDCHSAFKVISYIYNQRIIVRDANRFHHFQGGACSCKDYW